MAPPMDPNAAAEADGPPLTELDAVAFSCSSNTIRCWMAPPLHRLLLFSAFYLNMY